MNNLLQTTIVPRFINPPKGNAVSWSLKDANDVMWGFPPALRPRFTENVAVHVAYDDRVVNGRTFHNIKDVVGAGAPAPAPQPAPQYAPPPQNPPVQRQYQPPAAAGPAPWAPTKDEHIFCCGLVNNWVGALGGRFPTTAELVAAVNTAREAFYDTLGNPQ